MRKVRRAVSQQTLSRFVFIMSFVASIRTSRANWLGHLQLSTACGPPFGRPDPSSCGSHVIDLGDQFLALQKGRKQPADDGRHFGLVVDDKEAVRKALAEVGVEPLPGRFLDFLDPWGNRFEIVGYDNIRFTKAPHVLRGMGLDLEKNANAKKELAEKGMAPGSDR